MNDIFNAIKNLFVVLFSNASHVQFISIFVVAITSYNVAKFNASKPGKLTIKQEQLNNVYLPLYRLLEQMSPNSSQTQVLDYSREMTSILDRYYLLVFPQMHVLNSKLAKELSAGENYSKTLDAIHHQVVMDYELLKKALGYPSENFYSIFERMTPEQRTAKIILWITSLCGIVPLPFFAFAIPMFLFMGNKLAMYVGMGATFVAIMLFYLLLGKLSRWAKQIVN